eukprot:GFKZ01014895.1.p1 GENE.GFKZ01014895.1~~GFKZ01014895.1.p1  ORF type:complete len:304 (+),score=19.62 GFKZ01014895.1:110-1021(+)
MLLPKPLLTPTHHPLFLAPSIHRHLPYTTPPHPPQPVPLPALKRSLPSPPSMTLPLLASSDLRLSVSLISATSVYLLFFQQLTSRNLLPSQLTRKLIHLTSGPLFLLFWPFYSHLPSARFIAAFPPFLLILALFISGNSSPSSPFVSLATIISRRGNASEALKGPLYYCIILFLSALVLFQTGAGVIAISTLAFGDGLADPVGRRFGASNKWGWQWTGDKSIAGTLAFCAGAWSGAYAMLQWTAHFGMGNLADGEQVTLGLAFIAAVCGVVEMACPIVLGDDNVMVTLAAVSMALLVFGGGAL